MSASFTLHDAYTAVVLKVLQKRYQQIDRYTPGCKDVKPPEPKRQVARIQTVHGVQVPMDDEDWPRRTLTEKVLYVLLRSAFFPLADRDDRWPDSATAIRLLRSTLTPRCIPEMSVQWTELESDEAQSRLAFAGLASMLLMRQDRQDPDGAQWVVDLRWLGRFEVRPGFERYGAAAYFDGQRRLVRIAWIQGLRDVRPGDLEWNHAKYVWRTTLLVALTLSDHLWGLHLRVGIDMVMAMREHLSADHPLRMLLKPYTFRTVAIGHRAVNALVVRRGLPHRAFSLTYDSLAEALRTASTLEQLRPFPDLLQARGTYDLPDFPYAEDGMALWRIVERFVRDFLHLYFVDDGAVASDAELQALWLAIAKVRGSHGAMACELRTREQIVQLAASFVFYVAGMHKHVGALSEYVLNPSFMGCRIRPGLDMNDVQGSIMTMLVIGGTAFNQPMLMDDYSHILPKLHREEARLLMAQYQLDLAALSDEIEQKNTTRLHPFRSFCPRYLEVSVSL